MDEPNKRPGRQTFQQAWTHTYTQAMHSSLEDEGGIYLKPVMVTAKRAATAETHLFHCVLVKEQKLLP